MITMINDLEVFDGAADEGAVVEGELAPCAGGKDSRSGRRLFL